jgi:RimJ/RimL family protein N-acetyltransferase
VSFDRQPRLVGDLLELRPIRAGDFEALFRVAADPLIWEQHPEPNRYQEATFRAFFDEALASGGALVALDRSPARSSDRHAITATMWSAASLRSAGLSLPAPTGAVDTMAR